MKTLVKTPPPHIHASESVTALFWKTAAALLPILCISIFYGRLDALRLLVFSVTGAVLGEWAGRKLFQKTLSIQDGHAVLMGLLLGLILPQEASSWQASLAAFFSLFVGKEIFGGLGAHPFNLVFVGLAFFYLNFPGARTALIFQEGIPAWIAVGISCLIFGWQKIIHWEVSLLYLAALSFISLLAGLSPFQIVSPGILFAAFFILTDDITTPMTRPGLRLYALGAGVLSALLARFPSPLEGIGYAVLVMNACVPWIDHSVRPGKGRQ